MSNNLVSRVTFCLLSPILAMLLIGQLSAPALAQTQPQVLPAPKRVLLLYTYGDGLPAYQKATPAFLSAMEAGGININDLFFEYLDLQRNNNAEYRQKLAGLLRYKYAKHQVGLIVTVHTDALNFLLDEGKGLFPDAPIFSYLLVRPELIEARNTGRRILLRPQSLDMRGTLEIALKMFPQSRKIVFVTGTSSGDRNLEQEAKRAFEPWRDKLEFQYTSDRSVDEILQLVASLPSRSVVIYSNVFSDRTGRTFIPREVGKMVAKAANAPVFCLWDTLMGGGPIGGSLLSFEAEGNYAASVVLDMLNGKIFLTKPVTMLPTSKTYMFDSQQLKRWGVKENILPEGSVLVNRVPTMWEQYKVLVIVGIAVFLAQTMLVIGLLIQRRRKIMAEEALKEQLGFERLISDLSAKFQNIAPSEIDREIEAALKRIVDFFRVSHCVLIKGFREERRALITHAAHADDIPPTPLAGNLYSFFPWTSETLAQGKTIWIPTLDNLPTEASADREMYRNLGVRSFLIIPIFIVNLPGYAISISIHKEAGVWPQVYISRLQLLGEILVNTLERKRAEDSLRQKTEELDQFFNVGLDLKCIANTDAYFLRLNPAWERILGYTREELMAKRFLEFVHPDDLGTTQEAVSTLSSQQKLTSFENRYRCKDGTYRWLEWSSAPAGNLIFAAARDVTERKQAEEALEDRLRFERLMSDVSARFVNIPPDRVDSEIEYGLRQILEFFQVDRCGLVRTSPGKTTWQITHVASAKDVPAVPQGIGLPVSLRPWAFEKLILKREVLSFSRIDDLPAEANVEKQGYIEWGIRSNLNIPIIAGEPADYIIAIHSVKRERVWPEEFIPRLRLLGEIFVNAMERKQMQGEIQNAAEEWQTTFDSVRDLVMILDPEFKLVRVNAATLSFFNLPLETILGKHCYDLMHGTSEPVETCPLAKMLKTKTHEETELYDEKTDAWLHVSVDPVFDDNGQIIRVIHTVKDITERKRAEAEASNARRELLRMERLSRMGELTASLAHELNQPLAAILSNAQAGLRFIQSEKPDLNELREILQDISSDDKRAGSVIRSLRAMMKQEEKERESFSINEIVSEVVSLFHSEAVLRNVMIDMDFGESLPALLADKIQLQQVVLNLMMNAAEAMDHEAPERRKMVLKTRRADHGAIQVAIRDCGPGIEEEKLDRVFQPFFTTKGTGLGMGLSFSRSIIEAHGGRLWVENNPDKGATFFFEIPILR